MDLTEHFQKFLKIIAKSAYKEEPSQKSINTLLADFTEKMWVHSQ